MNTPPTLQELFTVTGRTALVTGASSGLGERFCETLAAHGARVVCCARREERLNLLVDRINESGGKAIAHQIDVADGEAIPGVFDRAEAEFGLVDILVNNAGMVKAAPIQETSDDSWDRHLAVNLTAVFKFTREAACRLIATGSGGSIINIASAGGIIAFRGSVPYAAAKGGVLSLTRTAAVELAPHRVRCNCIVPGHAVTGILPSEFFETERGRAMSESIPLGYPADVSDFDGTLMLLASDASRYITGAQIVVDGGITISRDGSPLRKP